jgi:hypothetical protein
MGAINAQAGQHGDPAALKGMHVANQWNLAADMKHKYVAEN